MIVWQFFVCCHVQRDKRCGVCGPPLVVDLTKALGDSTPPPSYSSHPLLSLAIYNHPSTNR